ncbi:hypothetical protein IMX26_04330 [Clostridium sp. 'deep sea']|uniref:hypothetical protein n=1 Tax=Clostridium sp. 'deep sea' TaxID=2779445 RepID=UPI0018967DA2|nr:hypothetical protein [Clostridium sp. 'deep sea']QOR36048.1 hypothetical protein IMX26_04330 [Clostridium sp. 'deep sea']
MRKKTIFYYELKRLVCSWSYLLLLAVVLFYCQRLLHSAVIFGTMFTAPFSQWTFCNYISSVMSLLLILLLALCAQQFTPSERGAMSIINATPMPVRMFKVIRYSAIACAFMMVAVLPIIICFAFYWFTFDYTAFGSLIVSALTLLLPSTILVFGIAMLLGNKKTVLLHIMLIVVLIIGVFGVSLPAHIDIIGSSVTQPLYAGTYDFSFTLAFVVARIAFSLAGIACIIMSLWLPDKRKTRCC